MRVGLECGVCRVRATSRAWSQIREPAFGPTRKGTVGGVEWRGTCHRRIARAMIAHGMEALEHAMELPSAHQRARN